MSGLAGRVFSKVGRFSVLTLLVASLAACSGLGSNLIPNTAPTAVSGTAVTALMAATNAPEWAVFLPPGAIPVASASGDLDADGDEDTLVVYAPSPPQDDAARTLLVLLRDADGVLRPSLSNPKAILCRRCGGMMGDPLQSIETVPGGFTLHFEGGSRELWSTAFRFEYVKADGWRLVEIDSRAMDRMDGTSSVKRRDPRDFGEVMLRAFDADESQYWD